MFLVPKYNWFVLKFFRKMFQSYKQNFLCATRGIILLINSLGVNSLKSLYRILGQFCTKKQRFLAPCDIAFAVVGAQPKPPPYLGAILLQTLTLLEASNVQVSWDERMRAFVTVACSGAVREQSPFLSRDGFDDVCSSTNILNAYSCCACVHAANCRKGDNFARV